MSERDTDIEFDFFDEPETEEATNAYEPPGGRPRGAHGVQYARLPDSSRCSGSPG